MNLNEFMSQQTPPAPQEPVEQPSAPETAVDLFAELPDHVIPEGTRNSTMSRIAGCLVKRYGNTDEAKKLFAEKAKACNPPLSRDELKTIWKSAVKFGKKVAAQPGYVPPEEYNNRTPLKPDDYSDVGQAYAVATMSGIPRPQTISSMTGPAGRSQNREPRLPCSSLPTPSFLRH